MDRIVLKVAPGELEHAIDHAMPLLPAGLRVDEATDTLTAIGEPHELPTPEELGRELGRLLREPPGS